MLKETTEKEFISFDNSFARLVGGFHVNVEPTPVAQPHLVKLNHALAQNLGIDLNALEPETWAVIFSGNLVPPTAEPLAMAYAGHQFGNFVPQLGDGRAILLGEVVDAEGARRDIQLKGAGLTPFSRQGDGRAALGPVLREYLVSEAMHALGIPTTRSLAAVGTGEPVYRETVLPGAVLTRVASSHVRVGTFEYFAARRNEEAIRELADYVIDRHYPEAKETPRPYLALLESVMDRQAHLVAAWLHVGFIHGVMNTDNMAISGETIDYGPCAFMDMYDPATVFSSIDHLGRYAYGNQPTIAQWNLARLAETLLSLIDPAHDRAIEAATEIVEAFPARFRERWLAGMRRKLGLLTAEPEDGTLIQSLLDAMHQNEADFTLTFRRLCEAASGPKCNGKVRELFAQPGAYDNWAAGWRVRLGRESKETDMRVRAMRQVNPAVIPRNHRVEKALAAAVEHGDLSHFENLSAVLLSPYEEPEEHLEYTLPPKPEECIQQTFCGT